MSFYVSFNIDCFTCPSSVTGQDSECRLYQYINNEQNVFFYADVEYLGNRMIRKHLQHNPCTPNELVRICNKMKNICKQCKRGNTQKVK
jgi:hypothetical protein